MMRGLTNFLVVMTGILVLLLVLIFGTWLATFPIVGWVVMTGIIALLIWAVVIFFRNA